MDSKPDFNSTKNNLEPLHTETWEGFLYISLSQKPSKSISKSLKHCQKILWVNTICQVTSQS